MVAVEVISDFIVAEVEVRLTFSPLQLVGLTSLLLQEEGRGQQDKVLAVGVDWAFLRVEPFMIIITGFVNITSLMEIMDNMVVAVADTGEDLQNREGVVGSIHQ